jgi:hypothetical protein
MATPMESTSVSGASDAVSAEVQVSVAQKAKQQERLQGAQAVQLIEAAAARPLPPDATYSVRI